MPCRTRMRPPRFPTKDVSTCMGSPTARGSSIRKPFARGGCCLLVSELDRHLGIRPVSQLDTQPVVSPVNASRLPSRAETSCITRGRGGWLGLTPWKTCTSYPLPAFLAHSPSGQSRCFRPRRHRRAFPRFPESRPIAASGERPFGGPLARLLPHWPDGALWFAKAAQAIEILKCPNWPVCRKR
jgi:hypothetical protein